MSEKEYALLLHEHKLARDDVRNFFSVVATLVSVTVLVLTGAVTALIVARNNTNHSAHVSDWVWGFAPLIPLGLLAIMAALADSAGMRSRTLHYIEECLVRDMHPRTHVLSYRLVRPTGLSLVAWVIADLAVVTLLSALTAALIYFIDQFWLRIGLGVLYGSLWLVLIIVLVRGYHGSFSPKKWWKGIRRTLPDSPADTYDI